MSQLTSASQINPSNARILDFTLLEPAFAAAHWVIADGDIPIVLRCSQHGTGYLLSRLTTAQEMLRILSHACCLQENRGRPTKGHHRNTPPPPLALPPGRPRYI